MQKKEAKLWDRTSQETENSKPHPTALIAPSAEKKKGEEEGPAVEIQEDKFSKCKFPPKPLNFGCFGVGLWISIVVGGLYFVLYGVVLVITGHLEFRWLRKIGGGCRWIDFSGV
jgi:hypothetical protein